MVSEGPRVAPDRLRALLSKLRDVDLHRRHVALAGSRRVSIAGCLSRDFPVGRALRYLLRWPNGSEEVLEIDSDGSELLVQVCARDGANGGVRRAIDLRVDDRGRATAPDWGARIDLDAATARDLDRFLRRIVRGLL